MSEVLQYFPWQLFLIIAVFGILLTAIACAPTALVDWVHQKLKRRR